jgi:hypothetical protein
VPGQDRSAHRGAYPDSSTVAVPFRVPETPCPGSSGGFVAVQLTVCHVAYATWWQHEANALAAETKNRWVEFIACAQCGPTLMLLLIAQPSHPPCPHTIPSRYCVSSVLSSAMPPLPPAHTHTHTHTHTSHTHTTTPNARTRTRKHQVRIAPLECTIRVRVGHGRNLLCLCGIHTLMRAHQRTRVHAWRWASKENVGVVVGVGDEGEGSRARGQSRRS